MTEHLALADVAGGFIQIAFALVFRRDRLWFFQRRKYGDGELVGHTINQCGVRVPMVAADGF
jgi:hypothetical protein